MERTFFVLGAFFALTGVAVGAFGAHGLASRIGPEHLATFETGARYQMYHAFALLLIAWAWTRWPGTALTAAGWLFSSGIVLFSGSLYALSLGAPRWSGAITPLGGLSFMAGWAAAIYGVLRS